MALASRDFTVEQGTSFILQFNLLDDYGCPLHTVNGLTMGNYSFSMTCRRSKYGGITANLLYVTGVTLLGPSASVDAGNTRDGFYVFANNPGQVKFVLSSNSTASVKYGRHDYDIDVVETKASGLERTRLFVGKMTFDAEAAN